MTGGCLQVRLVDDRRFFADRESSGSLIGPGDCVYLPEDQALHFVARGWGELVDDDKNGSERKVAAA